MMSNEAGLRRSGLHHQINKGVVPHKDHKWTGGFTSPWITHGVCQLHCLYSVIGIHLTMEVVAVNCRCKCGNTINPRRYALGYRTCIECGSPNTTRTVVPLHKSAYQLVTDYSLLRQLNKYGSK